MSTWNRLRWPFKALVIALPIIAAGYFAINDGWFKVDGEVDHSLTETRTEKEGTGGAEKGGGAKQTETRSTDRIFAYQPEEPVEGRMKGIVEVGATGFNSFVVNLDRQKRWKIVSKDFGQSLVYEGLATTDDIRTGLKNYITSMLDKGVRARDIHFVISSGAQKVPKTETISSELRKMGYVVNLVTPAEEGRLALKSALPPTYLANAFVTDIGSGNTKISWMSGTNIVTEETPGSKYFEKDMADQAVYDEVKQKASRIPAKNREVCFIIGGTPFDLAKQHRKGEERYTVLRAPADYAADKPKTKAGLNIYKALQDATGCDTFVFDWDANFSIGFLLQMQF